ncbi:MAG: hypothetical protein ACXV95_13830 [Acidimicrobiales bacterium]
MSQPGSSDEVVTTAVPVADDGTRWSGRALLLVPLVLALAMVLWRGPQLVDDAFITMRYSAHLAHGDGPVFNVGQQVEGFSDPLWMLILAGASLVGLPLPQVALVVGVLAFPGVVVLTVRLADLEGAGQVGAIIAGVVIALSSNLVGASLGGLETSLFALGLTATVLIAARDPLPRWWLVAALVVVAYSRPEGLPLVVLIVVVAYLARRRWSLDTNFFAPLALGTVAVIGGTLLARWAYYGELLPMSVIAKRDFDTNPVHSLVRAAPDGLRYVTHALGKGWLVLVAVTVIYLVVRWRPASPSARVAVTLSLAIGAVGVLVAVSNGGDWMANGRLLVPYVPALVAMLTAGIAESTRPRVVLYAWAVLIVALQPITFGHNWAPIDHEFDTVSVRLDDAVQPDEEVTTNVLGHLGYGAISLPLFDMHGLTEPSIAKLRKDATVYGKFDPVLVGQRADPVIALNDWEPLEQIVTASDATYVGVVSPQLEGANVFIALRADAADRFASSLSSSYQLEVVPFDEALAEWRQAAPDGQSPTAGP